MAADTIAVLRLQAEALDVLPTIVPGGHAAPVQDAVRINGLLREFLAGASQTSSVP